MATNVLTFNNDTLYEISSFIKEIEDSKKLTVVKTPKYSKSTIILEEAERKEYYPDNATTILYNGIKTQLLYELEELKSIGIENGWFELDNKCAEKIQEFSYNQAYKFIGLLDETIIKPTTVPHLDGTLGYQWLNNNKISSISFNQEGKFIYCLVDYNKNNEESGYYDYTSSNLNKFIDLVKREFGSDK